MFNAIIIGKKQLNRIKVVLVENNKSNKWLAHKLGKNEATISRWCINDVQPTLPTLVKIAEILEVTSRKLNNDK